MRKRNTILLLFLLWELEYLPIPVFIRSINEIMQQLAKILPLIVLVIAVAMSIKWLKFRSALFIPLLLFLMFVDLVIGDVKRDICNRIIVFCNSFLEPRNAFNPILGVVMHKNEDTARYTWGFFFPETAEDLFYVPDHNQESTSDREEVEVIDKDWYCVKFDVEF
jgi:hypothetical protein